MSFDTPLINSLSNVLISQRNPMSVVAFDPLTKLPDSRYTDWQTFQCDIAKLAFQLVQQDAQRYAICIQDSYLFSVAFFASLYANKSIVLPGNYQPAALAELTPHFDCLIVDEAVEAPTGITSLNIEQRLRNNSGCHTELSQLNLDTLKVTLFTSGSSGTPKAIEKSLKQLDIEIAQLEKQWGTTLGKSRIHSTVSHQHIYGLLFRVLWPICSERAFSRHDLEFPEQVVTNAKPNTTLISSPALLKRMSIDPVLNPFCAIFSSGGPLSFDSAQQNHQRLGSLPIEVYGSTETGGIAFRQQIESSTPWTLFPCINVRLNHENCLTLLSPYIEPQGWYQTSDECELLENSQFVLKGRTDRVIKIEEKRVSLVEVEKRIEQLNWIDESVVIPFNEPERLILAAVLTLSLDGKKKLTEIGKGKFWLLLRAELRQWLEPIAIPRRFRIVTEIPLNSQGKRLRSELEKIVQN